MDLGSLLDPSDRRKVLIAFRGTLFPARRPGRRRKERITAAHQDWKNGMRGLALYRAHIPGWERHNRYRRQSEARALMDAVRTRDRRRRGISNPIPCGRARFDRQASGTDFPGLIIINNGTDYALAPVL
jgi:hypothetical protein